VLAEGLLGLMPPWQALLQKDYLKTASYKNSLEYLCNKEKNLDFRE